MIKIRASCLIVGKNFSPMLFSKLSSVRLIDAHEPGDIGSNGRFKGKPTPFGSASIEVSDKAEEKWSSFDDLITTLEGCIDGLRKAGASDITFLCSLFHDGQCGFSFSKDQLKRMSALNVDFSVSCYDKDIE